MNSGEKVRTVYHVMSASVGDQHHTKADNESDDDVFRRAVSHAQILVDSGEPVTIWKTVNVEPA